RNSPSSCTAWPPITTRGAPGRRRPPCSTTRTSSTRSPPSAAPKPHSSDLSSLLLALGASLAWGFGDFFGPLASRSLGVLRVLFWAQVGGVLAISAAVAIRGEGPAGWAVLFAIAAAIGGMLGLFAYYRGMTEGAMSVVAPIAGASAIIPVIFGIAT